MRSIFIGAVGLKDQVEEMRKRNACGVQWQQKGEPNSEQREQKYMMKAAQELNSGKEIHVYFVF